MDTLMSRILLYYLLVLFSLGGLTGVNAQSSGSAQKTGISASFGGASFSMDDMKYLQESILGSYPLEGAIISSFPPYFSGSVQVVHQFLTHLRAGAGYTYTTTGGKTDYTDYSGSVETNMTAISHRLGVSVNYSIMGNDRLDLSLYGKVDANLSSIDISSSIEVLGLKNGIQNKYKSVSPNLSAGLELLYKFKESAVGIEAGYLVDTTGELSNKESGTDLLDPNNPQRILTSDWTGWRLGIKGIIWIK